MDPRHPAPFDADVGLPVDRIREAWGHALRTHRCIVVAAETGAGKSTALPRWAAAHVEGLVLVVEPRRVACRELARFTASSLGEAPGERVGYAVRGDVRSSANTRVLFATPGVALRRLNDPDIGALVLDEFHERRWELDLIAASSLSRSAGPPLALVSATLDVDDLAARTSAHVLRAPGRTFPIDVAWDDDVAAPSSRDLDVRAAKAVRSALAERDGDVLVFMPGRREIDETVAALGRCDADVLPLHGSLAPDRVTAAVVAPPGARRRVIVATNIAETSITLPRVRTVIDSGLERRVLHRGGHAALALAPISASSMAQRSGRAGRVAAGHCVRLFGRRFRPDEGSLPEVERVELDELVLSAACMGWDADAFDAAAWLATPPAFAVRRARQRLRAAGLLDAAGGATAAGRIAWSIGVDAAAAALLVDAPAAIAPALCDVLACVQHSDRWWGAVPDGAAGERVREERAELLDGARHEIDACLRMLRRADPRRHGMIRARLEDARAEASRLRRALDLATDPTRDTSGLDDAALAEHVLRRRPQMAFARRPRADRGRGHRDPWSNGSVEVDIAPWTRPGLWGSEEVVRPDFGIVWSVAWLGDGGTRIRGSGRLVLPVAPGLIAAAGIGEREATEPRVERRRGALRVTCRVRTVLGGATVAEEDATPRGDTLLDVAAALAAQGRLWPGAADALRAAVAQWRLLMAWPDLETTGAEPPDVEDVAAWFRARLETLGVVEQEDLGLVELSDLVPDPIEGAGAQAWEAQRLLDDFPATWTYLGNTYACQVTPHLRRVTLEATTKAGASAPPPPRHALPSFRGFSVQYRKASRVVPLR